MRKSILGHFAILLGVALLTTSCAPEDPRQQTLDSLPVSMVDSLHLDVQIDTFIDTTYYTGIDSAALIFDTMFYDSEIDSTTLIFTVDNYTLGMPTAHDGSMHLANSAKGQHIHLIIENNPYEAHYSNEIQVKGDLSSKVFLAFLSRSYHLSLKHEEARYLHIPSSRSDINPTDPMIFASRPKGAYKGIDAESVLLDFYLVNANMPKSGYEVVVKVDGKEVDRLSEWRPYVMKGFSADGEYDLGLEIQGKNGEELGGMYSTASPNFSIQ